MNSEIFRQNEESNTKIRKSIKKKSNTTVITPTILNQGTLPIISLFDIKPKRFKKVYNILLFIYYLYFIYIYSCVNVTMNYYNHLQCYTLN